MCVKGTNIVQLLYGEDGFDTRYVEKVKFPTVTLSNADLEKKYKFAGEMVRQTTKHFCGGNSRN